MEKNTKYDDRLLCTVMHKLAEEKGKMSPSEGFAERLLQRIKEEEAMKKRRTMRRRIWVSVGMVATLALLVCIALHVFKGNEEPISKQVVLRLPKADEPEKHKEKVDTVKREQEDTVHHVKELPPVPRLPKRYMASQVKKEKDLDEPVTYDESADYDAAERYLEAPPTQSITSLIEVDYEDLKREIEERGRKIKENIELAINQNDEEE